MRALFLHQNFPGQFPHIAGHLASISGNQIVAIAQKQAKGLANVAKVVYEPSRPPTKGMHHYLIGTESSILNGQAVAKTMQALKQKGFVPDVIIGHAGWGETLYAHDVYADAKLINYFEFFYRARGADTDFDPEFPNTADDVLRIRTKNIVNLLSLQGCDAGISPTNWQKSLYPTEYQPKISVIHEGVNTDLMCPKADATFTLPDGRILSRQQKIVTFVSRNLEPYRGFHTFMRAVDILCKRDPDCHVIIIGSDGVSYGRAPLDAKNHREKMLSEVKIDESRVHFTGHLAYADYLKVLQISTAHVYLTVPFVLSWSMLEAMAVGCIVVGSNTAPVTEVIEHGKNGFLTDFFDAQKMVDSICEVLENNEQLAHIRANARNTIIERYPVTKSITQYEALFAKLLK